MRRTYVAFSNTVLGPFPLEESMRVLRTSSERYGLVVDSDMRVYTFRRPWDGVIPTREQLDKHNSRINNRLNVRSLEQSNPSDDNADT